MVEKEHEEIWETPMANKMLARWVWFGESTGKRGKDSKIIFFYVFIR